MIKKLLQFSLGNKFAIFLMVVLIIFGGVYASSKLKLELLPDVENPVISVQTTMPGATPQSTQDEISSKIDEQVRSLAYVKNVKTESIQNASIVTVEYENETDMDKAEEQLKKEIDKIDFKDEVGEPELTRNSLDAFPILAYSFTDKNNDLKTVTSKLNSQLIPKLQTIDGVQSAQLNGQTTREVTLKFKQDELDKRGLTAEDVENYLQTASRKTPLGLFQFGKTDKSIVVDGQFKSVNALKNLDIPLSIAGGQSSSEDSDSSDSNSVMSNVNQASGQGGSSDESSASQAAGGTAKLQDLASVSVGDERSSISKTNGKDAVNLQIVKSQDANTVQVAKDVQKKIDEFAKDNTGLQPTKTLDTAKPIEDSLYTMVEKAALGTIVAIIVILLFLRNIRTTAITVISIPLSILIALIALKLTDISLNILTLGALTVAIGRVIDDSIVVVENIYRRLSDPNEQLKGRNLIISATREVFIPIMSSTLVTIIVFLPLVFVSGSVGEMFRPFSLAIAFSLIASLLISITLVPALASTLFKRGIKQKRPQKEGLGVVSSSYRKVLKWSLNHKWIVLVLSIVILVATILLGGPRLGTSFISTGEDKFLAITYTPKPGETQEAVLNHAKDVENYLKQKDKVDTVQYSVGGPSPADPTGSTNSMAIMVKYKDDTPNFDEEPDKVLNHIDKFKHPGNWANQDLGAGTDNRSVEVTVKGPSTDAIKGTVNRIESAMKDIDGVANVKSDLSQTYEQYEIKVDQNKAAQNGISASQLAMNLNENLPEKTVTTVNENGKTIDVKVKQNKQTDWSKEKIENIELRKPTGGTIQLSDIASLDKTYTPSKLTQEEGDYATTVTGKVINKDIGGTTRQVMDKVSKVDKPNNVKVDVGGANDDINNAISQLTYAMLAAIIIVYLILVITFKGGLAPFTILFSLPFTVIGVILSLLITGETISVPSLIGMLMLIGIVVTNAIVLIDRVINNEQRGMAMKEALLEAGSTRIRPILMTAIATIGALIPLLFGENSSVLISKGMAATVIGGLISSTLLTLIVVPVIYEILFTLKGKLTRRRK